MMDGPKFPCILYGISTICMETCLGKCLSFISSKFISQIFMCESTTRIYIITLFMLQRSCNHYCTHFQRIKQDIHSLKILQQNVYDQFNDLLRPSMTTNYVLYCVLLSVYMKINFMCLLSILTIYLLKLFSVNHITSWYFMILLGWVQLIRILKGTQIFNRTCDVNDNKVFNNTFIYLCQFRSVVKHLSSEKRKCDVWSHLIDRKVLFINFELNDGQ